MLFEFEAFNRVTNDAFKGVAVFGIRYLKSAQLV